MARNSRLSVCLLAAAGTGAGAYNGGRDDDCSAPTCLSAARRGGQAGTGQAPFWLPGMGRGHRHLDAADADPHQGADLQSATSLGMPGRVPLSTSAFFTHSFRVWAAQPIFPAIETTAAQREEWSFSCSRTIRTARARTSGENLFVVLLVVMTPILSGVGASGKPGAVQNKQGGRQQITPPCFSRKSGWTERTGAGTP